MKEFICLGCGSNCISVRYKKRKYCSNQCQRDFEFRQYIEMWKQGLVNGIKAEYDLSNHIRRYIFEKYESKCCKCGWCEINPYSNTIPLEIEHIDGNAYNNLEENLLLLCPNCHSLTSTFRNLNNGKGRHKRRLSTIGSAIAL